MRRQKKNREEYDPSSVVSIEYEDGSLLCLPKEILKKLRREELLALLECSRKPAGKA